MKKLSTTALPNLLPFVTALLIIRVTVAVVLNYASICRRIRIGFPCRIARVLLEGLSLGLLYAPGSGPLSLILE